MTQAGEQWSIARRSRSDAESLLARERSRPIGEMLGTEELSANGPGKRPVSAVCAAEYAVENT